MHLSAAWPSAAAVTSGWWVRQPVVLTATTCSPAYTVAPTAGEVALQAGSCGAVTAARV